MFARYIRTLSTNGFLKRFKSLLSRLRLNPVKQKSLPNRHHKKIMRKGENKAMMHTLTKQLVNCSNLHQWADSGDFHGTPHWCVLKSASSWGQMLPNITAVCSLLGSRFGWRDVSSCNDQMRHWLDTYAIQYNKTPWLYEVTADRSSFLIREFRREDDPTQKCYIQETYVKGFHLDAVYRGEGDTPCVDLSRTLVVMAMSAETDPQYPPAQE